MQSRTPVLNRLLVARSRAHVPGALAYFEAQPADPIMTMNHQVDAIVKTRGDLDQAQLDFFSKQYGQLMEDYRRAGANGTVRLQESLFAQNTDELFGVMETQAQAGGGKFTCSAYDCEDGSAPRPYTTANEQSIVLCATCARDPVKFNLKTNARASRR